MSSSLKDFVGACSACRKKVLFAKMGGVTHVAIERCSFGQGDIALTGDLIAAAPPTATKVANGTGYRLHARSCKGLKSFTKPFRREVRR